MSNSCPADIKETPPQYTLVIFPDMLEKTGKGRIVNVSSDSHLSAKLDLDNLNSQHYYDKWDSYANTKLCNMLHTRELARRGKDKGMY